MKTQSVNISGFRFTITGKTEQSYQLDIERAYAYETVKAYGTLEHTGISWLLMGMTFEDAHPEVILQDFFRELINVRITAYPEIVKYYEANRQPDVFEICDKILADRKAI